MSKFSERCKFYLNERDMTLYKCSQKSGIERTTLHRMVTGKRLPPQEALTCFCECLRLDNHARDELNELYYEEKIGTARFQNRKFIRIFLEYMANTEIDSTLKESILLSAPYSFELPAGENAFYPPPHRLSENLHFSSILGTKNARLFRHFCPLIVT